MQEFKIAQTKDIIFLYPFPVVKERKFLIECLSLSDAYVIQLGLEHSLIENPLDNDGLYETDGLHTDQKTSKYRLKESEFASLKERVNANN